MNGSLWGIYFRNAYSVDRDPVRIANTSQYIIPPKIWFSTMFEAEEIAKRFMSYTIKPSGLIQKKNSSEYYIRWF